MNKKNLLIRSLSLVALIATSNDIAAYSNKTFLPAHSCNEMLAFDTIMFKELWTTQQNPREYSSDLEVTAFYSRSDNAKELGKFFSPTEKNKFTIFDNDTLNAHPDVNMNLVIYDKDCDYYPSTNPVVVQFAPTEMVGGVRFHYHLGLAPLLEGLFVRVSMPLVRVERSMGMTIQNSGSIADINNGAADLTAYFNGTLTTSEFAQGEKDARVQLNHALIDGKQVITGLGDIEAALGYVFVHDHKRYAALNLQMVLPTGNKPKGVHVFEPLTGNAGHLEFGIGFEGKRHLVGEGEHHVALDLALSYRYALEAGEIRTLGLAGTSFGQYRLVTNNEAIPTVTPLNTIVTTPAANVLTLNTNVTPGHKLQALLGLHFISGNFVYESGYNIRYQSKGNASLASLWENGEHAIIKSQTLNLTSGTTPGYNDITPITSTMIDPNTSLAETMSHMFYSSVGYVFNKKHNPVRVAVGGHYEIAGNNASTTNWGLNTKISLSF